MNELDNIETTNTVQDNNTNEQLKKRGRKPKAKKKNYFGEEEEEAFAQYVQSNDKNFRDRIFAQKLYYPFTKMIESIIRRYRLFNPDEDFEDTFFDTMSFMITKINNFDPSKNYKAYSYCGTVCKNYLILKRTQAIKKLKTEISYEMLFPTSDSDKRSDNKYDTETLAFNEELIQNTISELQNILLPENSIDLNENEIKIGNALLEMLMNWEEIFKHLGSFKFNKSCVLQFIREYTDLTTKEIRDGMKKYKDLYLFTKQKLIKE